MCLLLLARDALPGYPVVLAANRDEYHARPAHPLHWWPEPLGVAGGRDARAGGTWLAVRADGRFASVLNAPGRPIPGDAPSRGGLVPEVLADAPLDERVRTVRERASAYAGFHLAAGEPGAMWYVGQGKDAMRVLGAGIHGIDNAGLDPDDPRTRRALGRFGEAARGGVEALFDLLGDDTDPGPGAGDCRPVFIRDRTFGTRCSTVLRVDAAGGIELHERRFDAAGAVTGDVRLTWDAVGSSTGSG